jgi:peptidoglycan biosynthesis protein MviN/MurJ (putative lipid II flippase)
MIMLVLAPALARSVSFGAMDSQGQALLSGGIAALALGVLGESAFLVAMYASYARGDLRSPLSSMIVRTAVLAVLLAAVASTTSDVVVGAALAASAAGLISAVHCVRNLLSGLPAGAEALLRSLRPLAVGALAMTGPLWLSRQALGAVDDRALLIASTVAVAAGSTAVFVWVLSLFRAPEAAWLLDALHWRTAARRSSGRAGA